MHAREQGGMAIEKQAETTAARRQRALHIVPGL